MNTIQKIGLMIMSLFVMVMTLSAMPVDSEKIEIGLQVKHQSERKIDQVERNVGQSERKIDQVEHNVGQSERKIDQVARKVDREGDKTEKSEREIDHVKRKIDQSNRQLDQVGSKKKGPKLKLHQTESNRKVKVDIISDLKLTKTQIKSINNDRLKNMPKKVKLNKELEVLKKEYIDALDNPSIHQEKLIKLEEMISVTRKKILEERRKRVKEFQSRLSPDQQAAYRQLKTKNKE